MEIYFSNCVLTESGRPVLLVEENHLEEIELLIVEQVSIYFGDKKTLFNGTCTLTNRRIIWLPNQTKSYVSASKVGVLAMSLEWAKAAESRGSGLGLISSPKIVIELSPVRKTMGPSEIVIPPPDPGYIKLSFHHGKRDEFLQMLQDSLKMKGWEPLQKKIAKPALTDSKERSSLLSNIYSTGAGINQILNSREIERKEADQTMKSAFNDLDALMSQATKMVALADKFSSKLEQKISAGSADVDSTESTELNSLLFHLGIPSPVTKQSAGSSYHDHLSRQLFDFISPILQQQGGTMLLLDVYCIFNRARGTELISPDDLLNACHAMEKLRLPVSLTRFSSGVLVLQLGSQAASSTSVEILRVISRLGPVTAISLSQALHLSLSLAKQHLLQAEQRGLLCRDETLQTTTFYPNLFADDPVLLPPDL